MGYAETLMVLREGERLSQVRLAELAGMSPAAVGQQERGINKPEPKTIEKLARGLATNNAGVVNREREREYLLKLWQAAGYPVLEPVTETKHDGLSALYRDYPELKKELALLLKGNPKPADIDFVVSLVRMAREKRSSAD